MVHHAYQNHHIRPSVYMGMATVNDPIIEGERVFMLASDKKALADGDVPVKIRNFAKKEDA